MKVYMLLGVLFIVIWYVIVVNTVEKHDAKSSFLGMIHLIFYSYGIGYILKDLFS